MFDSCSAYQNSPEVLYLSHCVPNPPDKGEKIRAFHQLQALSRRYRVHLACFAKTEQEVHEAFALQRDCASIYVERFRHFPRLGRAAFRFALGGSVSLAYYGSRRMQEHALGLATRVSATVAYSSAMAQYAPPGVPLVADLVDVDSEKWFGYARSRKPAFLFRAEGMRLRAVERALTEDATFSYLSTSHEIGLLKENAAGGVLKCLENGVDAAYFDPAGAGSLASLRNRRFIAFVGMMSYYPNADAACRFATDVLPRLRRELGHIEFFVVGRDPTKAVRRLANLPGVVVTGSVPDVRPYLARALAVVAPLEIARGIQNKVLEALAMGRTVLASEAVARTFGTDHPAGLIECRSAADYARAIRNLSDSPSADAASIRSAAVERFSWARSMEVLLADLEALTQPQAAVTA